MTIAEIIDAIEAAAPPCLQEEWDNSGLQTGTRHAECTGVAVCVDVTDEVLDRAIAAGCNLVVSHHPLLFKGARRITPDERQGALIYKAILNGVTVYSAHTSLDNAPAGVSHAMAEILAPGAPRRVLVPQPGRPDCGTGVTVTLPRTVCGTELAAMAAKAFSAGGARVSAGGSTRAINTVALVGGSGGQFIADAVKAGADAIVTSDVRYHDFLDLSPEIFIVDITHFDSEKCAEDILIHIILEKFPNFAPCIRGVETNPINYL